jgi:hypothetical protein
MPGTDNLVLQNDDTQTKSFEDPTQNGFPPRETAMIYIDSFFDGLHSIFPFVHMVIFRNGPGI